MDTSRANKILSGKRVRLIKMEDMFPIEPGTMGTIEFVDDAGLYHVKWDNGRSLSLIPEYDQYEIIE